VRALAAWRSQAGGEGAAPEIRTPIFSPRRVDFRRGPLATRAYGAARSRASARSASRSNRRARSWVFCATLV